MGDQRQISCSGTYWDQDVMGHLDPARSNQICETVAKALVGLRDLQGQR